MIITMQNGKKKYIYIYIYIQATFVKDDGTLFIFLNLFF